MYKIAQTTKFRRDVKALGKRGYDLSLLQKVVDMLASGKPMPPEYEDHPLKGKYKGYRDYHIKDDWILLYKVKKDILILTLAGTGTHSDILE